LSEIDGSERSGHALRWALEEAKLRKTGIVIVHAWTMPGPPGRIGFYAEPLQDPEPFRVGAEKAMESFPAETLPERNDVEVELRVVQGSPAEELVAAAEGPSCSSSGHAATAASPRCSSARSASSARTMRAARSRS
jgi:nucleotide-binding universal stress UspA family protein